MILFVNNNSGVLFLESFIQEVKRILQLVSSMTKEIYIKWKY